MVCFFFNDTATTEIYTLSLHDALPIFAADRELVGQPVALPGGLPGVERGGAGRVERGRVDQHPDGAVGLGHPQRSEEHTSELQSRQYLVCRLLLEKKNK